MSDGLPIRPHYLRQNADEVHPTTNRHARRPGHLVWPVGRLGGQDRSCLPSGNSRRRLQAAPSAEPKVELLVLQSNLVGRCADPRQDVAARSQEPLENRARSRNVPLEKAFKFKQQAVGRILKTAKPAGSWLTEDDFYELGKGPQLKLKEGMRAVTVRIDDPAVSSSIIHTGCLVDVIFYGRQSGRWDEIDAAFGLRTGSAQSAGERGRSAEPVTSFREPGSRRAISCWRPRPSRRTTGRGPADGRNDQRHALRRAG